MRPAPAMPPLAKDHQPPRPELAPAGQPVPRSEPNPALLCAFLTIVALVPRLALMPFNENYYGDAAARTELAARWAAHPHWISSFADGAFQFGPLHLYLVAIALSLWPRPEHAGRVISLIFGTLSVVPLFLLTRRLFDWKAAVWACAALSVCGIHLQFSTTAASEALGLFLTLSTLALFATGVEEGRFKPIALAALVLNLACATRYDAWLYIPLLGACLLVGDKDRVAAVTRAVFFVLLSLPFSLVWMEGNELALGDPLAPIRHIERFHQAWVADGLGRWGEALFRLQNLFFWPGTALVALSPLVAIFGALGMWRAWRERRSLRWLIFLALAPAAYFTFRSAVLLNFQPLARFAAAQVILLLPFVAFGFEGVVGNASAFRRRAVAGVTLVLAVALPLALGLFTFRAEGKYQDTLRPISPTSTNSPALMEVARFVKEQVKPRGESIILDSDSEYRDVQIAFFGGLPEERMARHRWDTFEKRLRTAQPTVLIRIEGGTLAGRPGFGLEGKRVRLDEQSFAELPGFSPPFHVYRRE